MNPPHIGPREREVLLRLALHSWEIAEQLEISTHTVKNHVTHLRETFGEGTRTAILVAALRTGVVHLDELVGGTGMQAEPVPCLSCGEPADAPEHEDEGALCDVCKARLWKATQAMIGQDGMAAQDVREAEAG